jgi:hypothetical protein
VADTMIEANVLSCTFVVQDSQERRSEETTMNYSLIYASVLAMSKLTRSMYRALPALLVGLLACGEPTSAEEAIESTLGAGERIITQRSERFESLGREVIRTKILDQTTMEIREITRDTSGTVVDYDQLRREARLAFQTEHGAAHPALLERLDSGDGAPIEVDIEAERGVDLDAVEADVRALGGEILERYRRLIVARADPDAVREIIRLAGVEAVLPHEPLRNLALNSARDLGQEPLAVAHRIGAGVGFRVAVWEPMACVNRAHPDFIEVDWQPRYGACDVADPSHGAAVRHSTSVTGVLAADRGSAGTAGLFRGKLFEVDTESGAATDDMWDRQPHLVNASFTLVKSFAKMVDEEVYGRGIFVFNGAGNDANATSECELEEITYCNAYNALCIGGYNHQSTIGGFGDDTVTSASSYCNDPVSGRESPQVLGPWSARSAYGGWHIPGPTYGQVYEDSGGTSIATPGVTGLAALLLSNYPFDLWERPALMRAVLMASAQAHPIIDGGRRVPNFNDGVDDRMGVGAPNGDRAQAIMDARSYRYQRATPQHLGLQASFTAGFQERVRVVLAWDQCPDYSTYHPELKVDLDLVVRERVFGPVVRTYTNPSFADNWEVVEYIGGGGTVEIYVSAARFDACTAEGNEQRVPMAIAWTKEPLLPVLGSQEQEQRPENVQ